MLIPSITNKLTFAGISLAVCGWSPFLLNKRFTAAFTVVTTSVVLTFTCPLELTIYVTDISVPIANTSATNRNVFYRVEILQNMIVIRKYSLPCYDMHCRYLQVIVSFVYSFGIWVANA